jgi:primosomal protein N'
VLGAGAILTIMKIQKINSQSRRDFYADMVCEHCGHVEKNVSGYDDDYFHRNVIPKMKCKQCGEHSPEDYRPLGTKYAAHEVV